MSRKPIIKAPPIPKQEDPAVTIDMQDKQINMLLARIEQLTEQVDTYAKDCRKAEEVSDKTQMKLDDIRQHSFELEHIKSRLLGWQCCAREVIKLLVEK